MDECRSQTYVRFLVIRSFYRSIRIYTNIIYSYCVLRLCHNYVMLYIYMYLKNRERERTHTHTHTRERLGMPIYTLQHGLETPKSGPPQPKGAKTKTGTFEKHGLSPSPSLLVGLAHGAPAHGAAWSFHVSGTTVQGGRGALAGVRPEVADGGRLEGWNGVYEVFPEHPLAPSMSDPNTHCLLSSALRPKVHSPTSHAAQAKPVEPRAHLGATRRCLKAMLGVGRRRSEAAALRSERPQQRTRRPFTT